MNNMKLTVSVIPIHVVDSYKTSSRHSLEIRNYRKPPPPPPQGHATSVRAPFTEFRAMSQIAKRQSFVHVYHLCSAELHDKNKTDKN
jgi:hypothetical protein